MEPAPWSDDARFGTQGASLARGAAERSQANFGSVWAKLLIHYMWLICDIIVTYVPFQRLSMLNN